jgi:hypothetical protein
MALFPSEGEIRVDYVATIANTSAPDASSELSSTTPLASWLTPTGWGPAQNENEVTTTSLASTFITSVPGTTGGPITLTLQRDDTPASDTAWNLFKAGNVSGYLVARYGQGGATGAWTAGDKVEVFPGQSGQVNDSPSAENTVHTFTVVWYPSAPPAKDATVAA